MFCVAMTSVLHQKSGAGQLLVKITVRMNGYGLNSFSGVTRGEGGQEGTSSPGRSVLGAPN